MKIAIVMPLSEQRGGSELLLCQLMQYGKNRNVDWVAIFLEDGSMVKQFRSSGIETYFVTAGRLREFHRFILTVNRIATITKNSGAVLLFSWMGKAHLYSSLAAMIAGVPTLWYQHGVPSLPSWMDRIVTMLPTSGVLCCSKIGAIAQARLQPSRPVRVVYPSVDLERFDARRLLSVDEIRYKLDLPNKGPLIGIVGRLQQWKGMHTLVEAMPQVLKHYPDAHCILVGGKHDLEPAYEDYLKAQIKELKLDSRVILTGLQANVPEWMQAMDIIVHASNNEPFGIVIIEAMALGKPIIAGNVGGPTEIVQNGINGILTPYGNSDVLAHAILQYLDDPEFAHHLGVSARTRALDFSAHDYANKFIEAVTNLVPSIL
jgi:glycosyltransferase involved in cell wall biosynthesis